MKLAHVFIDRPILSSVLSIILVLAGVVAMLNLPVAQFPDITPPQISVSATYPGASAEVVSQNVAAPIEQQVNGADGMMYMTSTSSSTGNVTLSVFFEIGTDPSLAQVDVQNRVNLALPTLPSAVSAQGVTVAKKSAAFMVVIAIFAPDERYDANFINNYANINVLDAIKRIPGANQSAILGSPDYAMRLWLKPDRMAGLGLTATDVQNAVAAQNQQYAAGRLGAPPTATPVQQTFPVTTTGRMTEAAQFEQIILRAQSGTGAIVRVKDIGRAELGAKDYSIRSRYNGKTATLIVVYQQPGANALQVAKDVRATLANLKQTFPEGMEYDVALDTTEFVQESIKEVIYTFIEAVILVMLVVFLFLQSWRATLIPILAVPVSIIGTFIGMTLMGFSINMLTLFGMVLAIGIVVDDAIVVVENVERNMNEFHLSPKDAAKKAMDEVFGRGDRDRAGAVRGVHPRGLPLAASPASSTSSSRSRSRCRWCCRASWRLRCRPRSAAILLKPGHREKKGFFKWFNHGFDRMTAGYMRGVATGRQEGRRGPAADRWHGLP